MHRERRRWGFKQYVQAGISLAVITTGIQPLLHKDNTQRVHAHFAGTDTSCFDPPETEYKQYPHDAIVVFAGGVGTNSDGTHGPNKLHELRLIAAAIAYIQKLSDKLVLTGENIAPHIDPYIDAYYVQNKVWELSGGTVSLPMSAIRVESDSVTTSSNLGAYSEIAQAHGYQSALGITNRWHIPRVRLLGCNTEGSNMEARSAEEMMVAFNPALQTVIDAAYAGTNEEALKADEEFKIWAMQFDPNLIWPDLWKEFLAPHGDPSEGNALDAFYTPVE